MSQSSAVLVIDMANDFVYPGGTIANAGGSEYQQRAQAIIPRLAKLLAAARAAGMQVIYATDAHTPKDKELRKWPPHSMAGSHEAEIVSELAPQPGDDAFQRGYDLVWVIDALQAFTDEAHKAGLGYFEAWYATDPKSQLKTVNELVKEWSKTPVLT